MYKRNPIIDLANEKVSILVALKLVGLNVSASEAGMKLNCPWGELAHSDGGLQRTFQVYTDTNTAYCFNCNQVYTPVKLATIAWNLKTKNAAFELLEYAGYKPKSLSERWQEIEQGQQIQPDRASLGLALKLYCSTIDSDWETKQFDSKIADKLDKCLSLLGRVRTDDDAIQWLDATKEIMRAELKREAPKISPETS